jgi:hypothetical protein
MFEASVAAAPSVEIGGGAANGVTAAASGGRGLSADRIFAVGTDLSQHESTATAVAAAKPGKGGKLRASRGENFTGRLL